MHFIEIVFLDATAHLYVRPCPSVGPLVGNAFVNVDEIMRNEQRGRKKNSELKKMKKLVKDHLGLVSPFFGPSRRRCPR